MSDHAPENTPPSGPTPPPQPAPPLPEYAYRGQEVLPPRRSMGAMLVVVAIGCLLFSVGCGCIDTWWSFSLVAVRSGSLDDAVFKVEFTSQMETAKARALRQADTPEERERIIQGFDALMREGLPEALERGVQAVNADPATSTLQTLGFMAVIAHIAMFVAGILLFLRRPAAKWVGIISCVLIVGLNAAIAAAMQDVTMTFMREVTPVLESVVRNSGQALDTEIAAFASKAKGIVAITTLVGAVLMSMWPVTAALILGFSRGIARDTAPRA